MGLFNQLRKGSTHLLILSVLAHGRKYGYRIMRDLEANSEGYFKVTASLLYPTLHKLEEDGLIVGEWVSQEKGQKRKYYTITDAGKKALNEDAAEWKRFNQELFDLLNKTPGTV